MPSNHYKITLNWLIGFISAPPFPPQQNAGGGGGQACSALARVLRVASGGEQKMKKYEFRILKKNFFEMN